MGFFGKKKVEEIEDTSEEIILKTELESEVENLVFALVTETE